MVVRFLIDRFSSVKNAGAVPPPPVETFEVTYVIDEETMSKLLSVIGTERFETLAHKFMNETDEKLASLLGSDLSDEEAANSVHKMAGSAASFGAVSFKKRLLMAEEALRGGNSQHATDLIRSALNIWDETKHELKCAALQS